MKRYTIFIRPDDPREAEDPDGQWVKHDDHVAEVTTLRGCVASYKTQCEVNFADAQKKAGEIETLKSCVEDYRQMKDQFYVEAQVLDKKCRELQEQVRDQHQRVALIRAEKAKYMRRIVELTAERDKLLAEKEQFNADCESGKISRLHWMKEVTGKRIAELEAEVTKLKEIQGIDFWIRDANSPNREGVINKACEVTDKVELHPPFSETRMYRLRSDHSVEAEAQRNDPYVRVWVRGKGDSFGMEGIIFDLLFEPDNA